MKEIKDYIEAVEREAFSKFIGDVKQARMFLRGLLEMPEYKALKALVVKGETHVNSDGTRATPPPFDKLVAQCNCVDYEGTNVECPVCPKIQRIEEKQSLWEYYCSETTIPVNRRDPRDVALISLISDWHQRKD